MDTTISKIDHIARLFFGLLLWAVSAAMTFGLLLALAGHDPVRMVVLLITGFGLEGGKIVLWRMRKGYRIISLALVFISLIASFGSAAMLIEENRALAISIARLDAQDSYLYQSGVDQVSTIDDQVSILLSKMKMLPESYVTASRDIADRIDALRVQRAETLNGLEVAETQGGSSSATVSMFGLLSRTTGISEDTQILSILLFLAFVLEASVLCLLQQVKYPTAKDKCEAILVDHPNEVNNSGTSQSQEVTDALLVPTEDAHREVFGGLNVNGHGKVIPTAPTASHAALGRDTGTQEKAISPDEFLAAMAEGLPYPTLHGRDATALKLGVPYYTAKTLVEKLYRAGKVKVQGRRLVLSEPSQQVSQPTLVLGEEEKAS